MRILIWLLALAGFCSAAYAELNCNAGIEFHPDGGIKRCSLNGNHHLYTTRGIKITCADGFVLEKYPGGRIKHCTLMSAATFESTECVARSKLELSPEGTLVRC